MSLHPRYLLVLDFEATCGDGIRDQEIIELPTFVYDFEEDKVLATFHEYIRPIANPRLTEFCTKLTGIEQVCSRKIEPHPRCSICHCTGHRGCRRYILRCVAAISGVLEGERCLREALRIQLHHLWELGPPHDATQTIASQPTRPWSGRVGRPHKPLQ